MEVLGECDPFNGATGQFWISEVGVDVPVGPDHFGDVLPVTGARILFWCLAGVFT